MKSLSEEIRLKLANKFQYLLLSFSLMQKFASILKSKKAFYTLLIMPNKNEQP